MTTKAKTETTNETALDDMVFGDEHISVPNNSNVDKSVLRQQKLKAIAFNEIERAKSSDLIGAKFDIVDAVRASIKGEPVATFIIELEDGKRRATSKPLNTYTSAYVDYFESFDEGETIEPMRGYTFAQLESGGSAGNLPVVLRKL